mmetsp:Transcript_16227/g.39656  ORF Transcript_16227/g.39656 Transcript_16227/m.39656 type:complete len:192 (+) Transcript_16227:79-654(+)|eukprot:CAMPEP_0113629952 /NCGR_PEP_ID=MMETSP0017_2-20120614/15555_1 /TAXON_ID=2856 /ORGANISM="Cylindrotheca closterium" /LENGTH=191 /DNA_ID=CAMNT_0000540383 /DNA_START=74 /DNA_END=649 /DNA_ORIENTATION=+ /assembly_acc=CAM_ASM_000147
MTDIYLSYSEPNLALAQDLKNDVESCSGLSVALEDQDWEETDDCDFQEHINQAKMFIMIATPSSNITAWVIDHNEKDRRRRRSLMAPPTVDFSSYEEGMLMLKCVLRVITGPKRFLKRRSTVSKVTKDTRPVIPQRSTSVSEDIQASSSSSSFAEANQLPTRQKRKSSFLESVTEGVQQMLQRGLGSTTNL